MLVRMLLGLVIYFLLVGVRVILNYISLRNYLRLPSVGPGPEPDTWPLVSIIIPARNEERNLPTLLKSLESLDYPNLEIIVVDDASSDATAAIARRSGAKTLTLEGPPEGWTGKNFACWTGAAAAEGSWLLFTDADTYHQSQSLRRTVGMALDRKVGAFSMLLQQRCITFWEGVMLPYAYQQYFVSVPYRRIDVPGDPAALANGQYFLIRKDAYEECGGHQAIKGEAIDDVALATRLKASGARLLMARGEFQASVRMYWSLREIWEGFAKNAYAFVRQRGAQGSLTILSTILSGLAIPCAIYGLVNHSLAFELAALLTYVASAVELITWQLLFQAPLLYGLFQPLAVAVFLSIAISSATRPKHLWKGRLV